MPSVKRNVAPISGEEAGRLIIQDLCRFNHNKQNGLPEGEGRLAPQELSDMLYGLATQADIDIYNEYRTLHNYFSQFPITLTAINKGVELAVARNHEELLMTLYYSNYRANEEAVRSRVKMFENSLRASLAYNMLAVLAAEAFGLPELTMLCESPVVDHTDPYNEEAKLLFPDDPPLMIFKQYGCTKQQQARAVTALRSKLPLIKRVEKALKRLLETDG